MIAIGLLLSACDALEQNAGRIGDDVKRNYDDTRYKVSDWIFSRDRNQPPPPPPIATRYCYRVQSDVLCYEREQPRLAAVLVGYQGSADAVAIDVDSAMESPPEQVNLPASGIVVSELPGSDLKTPFHDGPSPSAVDAPMPVTAAAPPAPASGPKALMAGF